jgi:hypothetical protein
VADNSGSQDEGSLGTEKMWQIKLAAFAMIAFGRTQLPLQPLFRSQTSVPIRGVPTRGVLRQSATIVRPSRIALGAQQKSELYNHCTQLLSRRPKQAGGLLELTNFVGKNLLQLLGGILAYWVDFLVMA